MSSFPGYSFAADNVKARFREQRMSEALGQRTLGLPRGVYAGFIPQVSGGSEILTLAVDSRVRFSSLKVEAQSASVQIDIFTKDAVTLNFTNHTQFPVFIIARAGYADDAHTTAQILTRTTGATGPQEINICKVDKPAADLVVDATVPTYRHLPVAFQGQLFGYMLPGAAEDIVFAQTVTDEVIRARYSIATPDAPPPTPAPPGQLLADRLVLDLAADYLASQLGLRNSVLTGNSKSVSSGVDVANVSGSFASTSREFEPKLTIEAGGSEAAEGAITASADTVRNVGFIVDETTGHRVIDADRHPVYGRLHYAEISPMTGTLQFENAQTTVQGTLTLFQTELQDGDIILGADGNWYEVESRTSELELELSLAYLGPDAGSFVSSARRFTLEFFSRGTGVEVAHTLTSPVNMRFFFSAWSRTDRSVFDALAFMHKVGERPVLGEATDTVAGRIRLAIAGAKVGAIHTINSNQAPIGNNFHTLNFSADNASVAEAGTGVANVFVQGDQGDPGPGAIAGPEGPVGAAGTGLQLLNPFETSGTLYGPGGVHTMTINFETGTPPFPVPGEISHVVGGFSRINADTSPAATEGWRIDDIFKSNPREAKITITLTGTARAKVFLGAVL